MCPDSLSLYTTLIAGITFHNIYFLHERFLPRATEAFSTRIVSYLEHFLPGQEHFLPGALGEFLNRIISYQERFLP
jgi:hypothetical protein